MCSRALLQIGATGGFLRLPFFSDADLAIPIAGEVTRERLDILRRADAICLDEIRKADPYGRIW